MQMNESCEACLYKKYSEKYPESAPCEQVTEYQRQLRKTICENKRLSAPEVVEKINELRFNLFGVTEDYTDIKKYFNKMMLDFEPQLVRDVNNSEDPLKRAVQYAMTGNFIDFGALHSVDSEKLSELLNEANKIQIDECMLSQLREELLSARRLVYLLDNCGEIVTDKVLMRAIRLLNPNLHITAIVRGGPVLNDATAEDAEQVALSDCASEILGNGSAIAGNVLSRLSEEALNALRQADLIISKGQGNYETLCGCGLNIYYIFMCKCPLFVGRFKVPLFSGIITKEVS